jgi:hypothetical protein
MYTQKRRTLLKSVLLAAVMAVMAGASKAHAQDETYKFDVGVGLGMSGYLGDVNESNMFSKPGVAAQLTGRYLIDTRWALRAVFTAAGLKGDSSQFSNVLPGGEQINFTSTIYDLGVRAEFNFFSYGIGETYKRMRRWSPYMAVGIGATMSSVSDGTYFTMSIPLAVGVKYKIQPRLNLAAEFCVSKTAGDHLDGATISDLYHIKSSFLKNTDWHSNIMISLTYEFGERCQTCHYVD